MNHGRPTTNAQRRLIGTLTNERGTTYTENDLCCVNCASQKITYLKGRKRDWTDYRPSHDKQKMGNPANS